MKIFNCDYKKYIKNMETKDVVLLDPPWNYNDKSPKATNQLSYELWLDNDKELDFIFSNIKAKHLFIWTTNSFIYNVLRANHYDFVYKTIVTWIKKTKKDKIFYGLGSSFRNCTEQLLIFTHKEEKPLHLSMRNYDEEFFSEFAGKRTIKPKRFEFDLLNFLQEKGLENNSYIFSGIEVNSFANFNIDLVDTALIDTEIIDNKLFFE